MKRIFSVTTLLSFLAGAALVAQSITIGPSRPGGNPVTMSSASFPQAATGSVVAPAGAVQRGTVSMVDPTVAVTSGNILVANSSYVRLKFMGSKCDGCAGTYGNFSSVVLTLNVVDGTHVTVTATRNVAGGGGITIVSAYEVTDLQPLLVNSIQRGSVSLNAGFTAISAVTTAKTELDFLGITGGSFNGYINLVSSTSVGGVCISTGCVGVNGGFQAVEWK